ncbi:hypothetical protein STANM309S_01818 [Streptomyces tanashiensis]
MTADDSSTAVSTTTPRLHDGPGRRVDRHHSELPPRHRRGPSDHPAALRGRPPALLPLPAASSPPVPGSSSTRAPPSRPPAASSCWKTSSKRRSASTPSTAAQPLSSRITPLLRLKRLRAIGRHGVVRAAMRTPPGSGRRALRLPLDVIGTRPARRSTAPPGQGSAVCPSPWGAGGLPSVPLDDRSEKRGESGGAGPVTGLAEFGFAEEEGVAGGESADDAVDESGSGRAGIRRRGRAPTFHRAVAGVLPERCARSLTNSCIVEGCDGRDLGGEDQRGFDGEAGGEVDAFVADELSPQRGEYGADGLIRTASGVG